MKKKEKETKYLEMLDEQVLKANYILADYNRIKIINNKKSDFKTSASVNKCFTNSQIKKDFVDFDSVVLEEEKESLMGKHSNLFKYQSILLILKEYNLENLYINKANRKSIINDLCEECKENYHSITNHACVNGKWNYKHIFELYPQIRLLLDILSFEIASKKPPDVIHHLIEKDKKIKNFDKKIVSKNENKSSGSLIKNHNI